MSPKQPRAGSRRLQDHRLVRRDEHWLQLPNPWGVPVEVCAGPEVLVEPGAVDEILLVLATVQTLERLTAEAPAFLGDADPPRIDRVVLPPDVHKGAGIPIGTVLVTTGMLLPQAVGNDINCGMRLEATSLTVDQVRPRLGELEKRLRHVFFQGGRRIALTRTQREALLREGLPGLLGSLDYGRRPGEAGVLRHLDPGDARFDRLHAGGGYQAATAAGFADWVSSAGAGTGEASYDSVIGSVGGGNHFAEVQYVAAVRDAQAAYAWGLRVGQVVLMVHTGSLGLGHQANQDALDLLRGIWPRHLTHPANGIFPLPLAERHAKASQRYLQQFANAANFALGNRLFLALMLRQGLAEAVGDLAAELVYDAPHNLLWPVAEREAVHRKGATPAGGPAGVDAGGSGVPRLDWWGEPVIVPGSMGAASYLLRGLGNARALDSACHGAGRRVARGALGSGGDAELDAFLREFRVVTPLDPRDPSVARRADVIANWRRELKQEAPWAYKDIDPVVSTLEQAGVARRVVELRPLLTVKA
jgi:tRNA-splicing ligase RtcB (3'-phosphate/5'-hydroxy nucleic acid ligase)